MVEPDGDWSSNFFGGPHWSSLILFLIYKTLFYTRLQKILKQAQQHTFSIMVNCVNLLKKFFSRKKEKGEKHSKIFTCLTSSKSEKMLDGK